MSDASEPLCDSTPLKLLPPAKPTPAEEKPEKPVGKPAGRKPPVRKATEPRTPAETSEEAEQDPATQRAAPTEQGKQVAGQQTQGTGQMKRTSSGKEIPRAVPESPKVRNQNRVPAKVAAYDMFVSRFATIKENLILQNSSHITFCMLLRFSFCRHRINLTGIAEAGAENQDQVFANHRQMG